MKLFIKNIGKIKDAAIEINGITAIAGENNTGKSTLSRALFAMFSSFCNVKKQIQSARVQNMRNTIFYGLMDSRMATGNWIRYSKIIAKNICDDIEKYENNTNLIKKDILKYLTEARGYAAEDLEEKADQIVSRIKPSLNVSDEEIFKTILEHNLEAEFNGQVNNIFFGDKGEISLEIKGKRLGIVVEENKLVNFHNQDHVSIYTEAVYIDNPFVLDDIDNIDGKMADHQGLLKNKLQKSAKNTDIMDEIVVNKKLDNIYGKISSVCTGNVIRNDRSELEYKFSGSDKVLHVRNLSAGLKTFVILKMLLSKGIIEENGTIILDEPEIHLHPEWQLLLAELIVLIHKEFGVHILLNTYSPYFLRAIQVYSAKYEVVDQCKYYLSEIKEEQAMVNDVTDHIDAIYEKLSRPLQKLEDLRWEDA